MDEMKKKRAAEILEFIQSDMIDKDKFHITAADCLLLLESQWEEFCSGSEEAFQIQREKDILEKLSKETGK